MKQKAYLQWNNSSWGFKCVQSNISYYELLENLYGVGYPECILELSGYETLAEHIENSEK